jgi:hypothetical protein
MAGVCTESVLRQISSNSSGNTIRFCCTPAVELSRSRLAVAQYFDLTSFELLSHIRPIRVIFAPESVGTVTLRPKCYVRTTLCKGLCARVWCGHDMHVTVFMLGALTLAADMTEAAAWHAHCRTCVKCIEPILHSAV